MTNQEILKKKEELEIQYRKVNQCLHIIENQEIQNAGTRMAISQYKNQLAEINNELFNLSKLWNHTTQIPENILVKGKTYTEDELIQSIIKILNFVKSTDSTNFRF